MLVSSALLVVFLAHLARFWSSPHVNKTSAINFSISTSKIHLAEVPSLKSNHPCIWRVVFFRERSSFFTQKALDVKVRCMQPQKHARASRFYHSRFKKHTRARCFFNYESALAVPTQAWMLSGANKSMAREKESLKADRLKATNSIGDVPELEMDSASKNPVKDFCWWDLGGVWCLVSVCRAVVDGSLDLSARATSFFI